MRPPPADKEWLKMEPSERPIETEEIRDPGADFGAGFLLVGLALLLILLAVLA